MENTTRPFTEDIRKTLRSLNLQLENWMNSQQPISLLEKDLIKENLRSIYQLIDELSTDKKFDSVYSEIQSQKLEAAGDFIQQPNIKISEEVTNTIRKTEERIENTYTPITEVPTVTSSSLYSSSIEEMIENATVINSVDNTVLNNEPKESAEEKAVSSPRIQEVKAATRYEEIRTIGSTYAPGASIGDKINKSQTDKSISEKINTQPLVDLKLSIGINERFAFINELFKGDQQLYHQSIDKLNSMQVYEDAQHLIHHELMQKLNWDENNSRLQEFNKLVKRRFNF